jgi:hypothetical protein
MFRRCVDVRGTRAAETRAEAIGRHKRAVRKTSSCRKKKSRTTRCLRFAARLAHAVNVRGMRESRVGLKCFPRCRILRRTTRRRCCASPRTRRKRLNGRPNFDACTRDCSRCALKRFHRHAFPHLTARGEAAKARRLPPVCRNVPSFRRKTPRRGLSESRRRADTRVKRLHGQTISFAGSSGLFANLRRDPQNQKAPLGGAPFAFHTVPLASLQLDIAVDEISEANRTPSGSRQRIT